MVYVGCHNHIFVISFAISADVEIYNEKVADGILVEIGYEVVRNDDGIVLVTGESSHCFVDKNNFKPVNLKRERPDMYEKFMKSMEQED